MTKLNLNSIGKSLLAVAEEKHSHVQPPELKMVKKIIHDTRTLLLPEFFLCGDEIAEPYQPLMAALDRAYLVIDWEGENFYETIEEAHRILMDELDQMEKHSDVTVNVVGHTHIDVAWLWRLKHTKEKAQRSFTTVLRLMEQYDEYIFQQAQPQLYKYMKEKEEMIELK